jgi:hypothetical protein
MKQTSLLPLTRLALGVTAVVQLVMSVAGFLLPDLARGFLVPSSQVSTIAIQYFSAFYLAGALASAYAFYQDNWVAARAYVLNAAVFVALALIVTLLNAATTEGITLIAWAYILLSVIYLPIVGWIWLQESKRVAMA